MPESLDFFAGVREENGFGLFFILLQIAITVTAPIILYSIYWYERYSADIRYRTLLNQLLSHYFLICLFGSFIPRIPQAIYHLQGPMSPAFCTFSMGWSRYVFLLVVIQLGTRQTIKFFYIFKWKYVVGLNDDFAAFFLTLNNIMLSALFIFTTYYLGYFTAEVDFHVCTGKHPKENIAVAFHYIIWRNGSENVTQMENYANISQQDPLHVITLLMLLLANVENLIIWLYDKQPAIKRLFCKKVHPVGNEGQNSTSPRNIRFEETKCIIIGNGGVLIFFLSAILLLSPMAMLKEVLKKNPADLNHGSGRATYYISRITMPLVSFYLFPCLIACGNRKMIKTLYREFKDVLSQWF